MDLGALGFQVGSTVFTNRTEATKLGASLAESLMREFRRVAADLSQIVDRADSLSDLVRRVAEHHGGG